MKMKSMTIVIKFEDGTQPDPVAFGDRIAGGEVTAIATYDLMHTMEIAENALENSTDERCIEAVEKIGKFIADGIYQEPDL